MRNKKRALVTGGAGFIGSHLVESLLKRGIQVTVLDNLSNGRLENLALVNDNSDLTFYNVDVSEFEKIRPLFEGVDWVFHLAALADIVPSIQNPLRYHKANVDGTVAVLEAARLAKVRRFVYAASSSCYGIPDLYPTPESAPIRPMYPYDVPAVALRLFNVYGPRSRTSGTYGAVFGVFLAQKLHGVPFTVVGDGTQTRDFTFVSDVVAAFIAAADSEYTKEVFNVGSGASQSVNRLTELLGGERIYITKRPGEPDSTFADIKKITSRLSWKPEVTFEKGVSEMLSQIEYWRTAPVWTENAISDATRDWHKYLGSEKS
jgi:UDP-glucose 4-epimerase